MEWLEGEEPRKLSTQVVTKKDGRLRSRSSLQGIFSCAVQVGSLEPRKAPLVDLVCNHCLRIKKIKAGGTCKCIFKQAEKMGDEKDRWGIANAAARSGGL